MNTEHTPGPWHVDYTQGIMAQDGVPIAYICDDYSDTPSPDACLIAAAPDLLAALKALRRECKYQAEIGNIPDNRVEFAVADAAIAKAEGKA